jgi:tetratricopeptide (TPR) repeat protein
MRRLVLLLFVCLAVRAGAQTVVVLPLFNLSGDANLDWIGESAAEMLRETLASEGILVLDRESREAAYRRLSLRPYAPLTHASVIKLGEELDAERIVYGSFHVSSSPEDPALNRRSSLQLAVRLMNLRNLTQSAEESVTSALEDLAEAQQRLAWQTLRLVAGPGAAPSEQQLRGRFKPVRLDAMESYIRGLMAASPEQKHRLFTQAARLDESFSQPCFQLGRLLFASKNYKVAAGWFERVPSASPHFLEAGFFLGLCRYQLGEYDKAIASLLMVVQSLPLNEVWNDLGAAQSRRNLPESAESFRKASEGDPHDPTYLFNLGYALWKNGKFEEAASKFRAVLDLTPEDSQAILMLGRCLKKTPPQETQLRVAGMERIKDNFEEMAYRQLQATMEQKGK